MPDLDILRRGVPSCFHVAYRLMRGGAPEEEVQTALTRGLRLALQRGGGVPLLDDLAALLLNAPAVGLVPSIIQSRELLREDDSRHAQLGRRSLQRLIASGVAPSSHDEARHLIAGQVCNEILSHNIFSRAHATGYELAIPHAEFESYVSRMTERIRPAVDALAGQLVSEPSASFLRTPRAPQLDRPSIEQMLDEVVT